MDIDEMKLTRPNFFRKPGEVGIYIDFMDVVPSNPNEYGSHQFMIHDFMDKLSEQLSKVPLYILKAALERKRILNGVVLERWLKGVILVAFVENEEALNDLWTSAEESYVDTVVQQTLNTTELLSAIGAKSISLRARVWKDEVEACRLEIDCGKIKSVPLKERENDIAMLSGIRHYQKQQLADIVQSVRDQCAKMQENFAPMTISLKQILKPGVVVFKNLEEFNGYYKKLAKMKPQYVAPFKVYFESRNAILDAINNILDNVCSRLAQVHSSSETPTQTALKGVIKEELQLAIDRLKPEFEWKGVKHPDWVTRIVNRDHGLFLGLASVVTAGMNVIVDVDQQIDEYFSGIVGVKIDA